MEALTINDLSALCKEQIKKGNGKKKILITSDDEGNAYHELFYAFLDKFDGIDNYQLPYGVNDENKGQYIILG